jgi:hypothetical protein
MIERPLTVGDVQAHAATLSAMASALLTGLARGQYDNQVAFTEDMILATSVVFPMAPAVEKGLEVFLALNKMAAPRAPIVPDGAGGFVPNTNSRVMPDGSLRPYDPAIDDPPPRRTHTGL